MKDDRCNTFFPGPQGMGGMGMGMGMPPMGQMGPGMMPQGMGGMGPGMGMPPMGQMGGPGMMPQGMGGMGPGFPGAGMPNVGQLENRVSSLERQVKRLDARVTRLETPYPTPTPYGGTGATQSPFTANEPQQDGTTNYPYQTSMQVM